jgi:hypothetical protein
MPRPFWGPFWVAFWGPLWGPIRTGTPSAVEKPCKERVSDSSFGTRQPSALRQRVERAVGSRGIACRRRPAAPGEIESSVAATRAGETRVSPVPGRFWGRSWARFWARLWIALRSEHLRCLRSPARGPFLPTIPRPT